MKRFSKILVAVLALCLLVGVLALAISANYTGIDGQFVVKGEGYDTWEEAVTAADNTHTIYLNDTWEPDTGIVLSGETTNVKVNLNGKTVTVKDGSMLFNVYSSAKLTIEGAGTLNNSGAVLIGGSTSGTVTVNATGAGIVINNNATEGDVNTFRFQSYSTLNVSGKIVVNTNAATTSRAIFNVADGYAKTVNLNIKDADILYAAPVTGAPVGKVVYSQFSNVKIDDSRLEGVYSTVLYAATGGQVDLSGYIIDRDASDAVNYGYDPAKLADLKSNISIDITENYTVNNSVIYSAKDPNNATDFSGSIMYVTGATKADFTNTVFYGHYRAIHGKQGNDSWSNIATKKTDACQLTFVDCHIRACENGSIYPLFCYGPNVRFLGGSINGVSQIANCQPHYVELDNGQWLGVYVDNVLGVSGLKGDDQSITSAWQNTAAYNPHATFKGTLTHPVTIVADGKSTTFTTGYITDDNFVSVIKKLDGNNVTAGAYNKDTNNPFTPIAGPPSNASSAECIVDANGNGYLKYSYTGAASAVNNWWYPQFNSFTDSDYIVFEFDIAADELEELPVLDGNFQFRDTSPLFGVDGSWVSDCALSYTNFSNIGFKGDNVRFNYAYYGISTEPGFWNRITVVFELNKGPVEKIKIPAFNADKTPATDESGNPIYIEKNAYSIDDSYAHFYVNGVLKCSVDFAASSWGYHVSSVSSTYNSKDCIIQEGATKDGAYIIEGYESKYYLGSDIRMGASATTASAVCLDNFYVAKYIVKEDNPLGLYDENGALKSTITPNDYVLVMPDNNKLPVPVVADVDGVEYTTEADAIAAIKAGSTVELFANFESYVPASAELKLITNGFTVPGFVSETHKVLDYSALGFYKLVEASESEIFTIICEHNGKTVEQTVAMGTSIPEMNESFPAKIEGNMAEVVTGWTLSTSVPNDYSLTGNTITATAVTESREITIVAGGVLYETLAEAVAGANGETIVLYKDITVDALDGVKATTYKTLTGGTAVSDSGVGINVADGSEITIDFNGKKITQNFDGVLFNVTNGTLNLVGSATFENVRTFARATGADSKFNVLAEDDGFVIKTTADGFVTFLTESSADASVSGSVTVELAAGNTSIFKMTGADTLTFDKATVIASEPSSYTETNRFITMGDNNHVIINDSYLKMVAGVMFDLNASSEAGMDIWSYLYKDENGTQYMYPDESKLVDGKVAFSIGEHKSSVKGTNSTIITTKGDYVGTGDIQERHCLFTTSKNGISLKADFYGCDFVSNSRVLRLGTRPQYSGASFSPAQLTFVDCDYSTDKSAQSSPMLMYQNCNVRWIGGNITGYSTLIGCASYPFEFQNGFAGVHFYNTNIVGETSSHASYSYDWNKAPEGAWTRYHKGETGAALVDGTLYATEAEALAAIKDGSKIKLLRDVEAETLKLALACTIDNYNYFKTPAIVSETHKAVVGANGDVTVSAALPEEIFKVNFEFNGQTATQTAALGTVIVAPEEFSDRFFDEESKKVTVLKGWTLTEGETVIVVTGNADAVAVTETSDPVTVYWTTEDGATVLDTDYYIPGENTELPAFDGVDIVPVEIEGAYYATGRTGWAGIENVNLNAAGEYTVKAVMGKVAPKIFPGLKYNLTLYSYYVLNFWIPETIEGVTVNGVGIANDGSFAFKKFTAEGTIGNVAYDRYGYILGAADTSLKTYYINYTLEDGTALTYKVENIGVPSYAVQIMNEYAGKSDADSLATQTLIVNMANYADKVLTVTGADKTTPGAKAYTYILETYGSQYLTRYNQLTNDKFQAGGDIYKADGVADLNWVTYTDDDATNNDADNADALSYVQSISFKFNTYEPMFIVKLSDAAIAKGIQQPGGSGQSGAHSPGLHAYSGFNTSLAYSKTWAEKDGQKYYGGASIWYTTSQDGDTYVGKNNCSTDYEYFVSGDNYGALLDDTYWNAHPLKLMTNKFTLRLEVEGDDGGSTNGTYEETGDYTVGYVYYSLAAYINYMIESDATGNADFIAAAKALYAYSEAAEAYSK